MSAPDCCDQGEGQVAHNIKPNNEGGDRRITTGTNRQLLVCQALDRCWSLVAQVGQFGTKHIFALVLRNLKLPVLLIVAPVPVSLLLLDRKLSPVTIASSTVEARYDFAVHRNFFLDDKTTSLILTSRWEHLMSVTDHTSISADQ